MICLKALNANAAKKRGLGRVKSTRRFFKAPSDEEQHERRRNVRKSVCEPARRTAADPPRSGLRTAERPKKAQNKSQHNSRYVE